MEKYNLYLFDFDGTLFDTLPSSKYVFKKAYEKIGISLNEDDVLGFTREPFQIAIKGLALQKKSGVHSLTTSKSMSIHKRVLTSLASMMILMTRSSI